MSVGKFMTIIFYFGGGSKRYVLMTISRKVRQLLQNIFQISELMKGGIESKTAKEAEEMFCRKIPLLTELAK